jgi:signal transduction histidine kinase
VAGDSDKLREAFSALIENGIKFTPGGGSVTVSTCLEGESLIVSIQDTGIGMKDDDVAVVTRPFHRLRSAFDGHHQGAGLGLPFAKSIFELHGGRFHIQSVVNGGTAIRIALPLCAQARADAA